MRFGLGAAVEWGPEGVITQLATLVRPGGSMQLVAADWLDDSHCGSVVAMGLFCAVFNSAGVGAENGRNLVPYMAASGLQAVDKPRYGSELVRRTRISNWELLGLR